MQPTDHDVLHGWKDIAAFTGKSVRTVQRWEDELGLPVRRLGPDREIVIALRSEVSEWLRRGHADAPRRTDGPGPQGPAEANGALPPPPPAPSPGPSATNGRRYLAWGIALLVLTSAVAAWLAGRWPAARPPGPPATWSVTADGLAVFDRSGSRLWTYTADGRLAVAFYDTYGATSNNAARPVRFVDLEGDGSVETVVRLALDNPYEIALLVLDAGGRRRFAHIPHPVRFGSKEFTGPWVLSFLQTSRDRDGRVTLWPAFQHRPWFPSVVQELAADGAVPREYWSNGHVTLIDVTRQGEREVVMVGGVHNETMSASVAVMTRDLFGGAAPAADPKYRCASCGAGHPEVFLVFPRLCVTGVAGHAPYVREAWFDESGRLTVGVEHGQERGPNGAVLYSIDPTFSDASADLMPGYAEAHRALERSGVLDHPFGPRDLAAALPVRKWNGTTLVPLASVKAATRP